MINILAWIVFGAIAGWIASIITKTDGVHGGLMNVIVGVVGATLGGFIMNTFGGTGITGFNLYSLFVSVVGAVILIGLLRAVRG